MEWVIEGVLARSPRPDYPAIRPAKETVAAWVRQALEMDIRSIICLLDTQEVALYTASGLEAGGLLEQYRQSGLEVEHIPALDYRTPRLSDYELARIWIAFETLPKPVLVHCSAGRDRTGAAIDYLTSVLGAPNPRDGREPSREMQC